MKLSEVRESKELQQGGAPIVVGDAVFYVRRLGTKESQESLKNIRQQLYGPFHKMFLNYMEQHYQCPTIAK